MGGGSGTARVRNKYFEFTFLGLILLYYKYGSESDNNTCDNNSSDFVLIG